MSAISLIYGGTLPYNKNNIIQNIYYFLTLTFNFSKFNIKIHIAKTFTKRKMQFWDNYCKKLYTRFSWSIPRMRARISSTMS